MYWNILEFEVGFWVATLLLDKIYSININNNSYILFSRTYFHVEYCNNTLIERWLSYTLFYNTCYCSGAVFKTVAAKMNFPNLSTYMLWCLLIGVTYVYLTAENFLYIRCISLPPTYKYVLYNFRQKIIRAQCKIFF